MTKSLNNNSNYNSLLGRETISLSDTDHHRDLIGSKVIVTGAAGSIGSEICFQLCRQKISKLIMLDISETGLFLLHQKIRNYSNQKIKIDIALADIRDNKNIDSIVQFHEPDLVYHAAAYKHVPLLEAFPREAINTNTIGTKYISDASLKYGVKKFLMISTDKAVNPTNIMGASKRAAEIYVNHLQGKGITNFITTRFGNVIGSNGSVVPIFSEQIDKGGPISITHPEVTRYFMTIPEAGCLVIEASVMGLGGEIYVFNMGNPLRVLEIARKMIEERGLIPNIDIRIEFSGLRQGEKLHEQLFRDQESVSPTWREKIMRARHISSEKIDVDSIFRNLQKNIINNKHNKQTYISDLSELIPEYQPNIEMYHPTSPSYNLLVSENEI